MLCKTFKMNGRDFTQYAHKYGLNVGYIPIEGLPSKNTLDGTEHDDILDFKAIYTIRLNPTPPDIGRLIISEYKKKEIMLTIYDLESDSDITIRCKPAIFNLTPALVQFNDVVFWQLSDLVFKEK